MSRVLLSRASLFRTTIPSLSINRLRTMGLSRSLARLVYHRMRKIVSTMGPERAVAHLKSVGQCLTVHLSGSGEMPSWVARMSPGDSLPATFPRFFQGCERLSSRILWRLTKISKFITFDTVVKSQVDKFHKAVVKAPPTKEELRNAQQYVTAGMLRLDDRNCRPVHRLQPFPIGLSPLVLTQKLTQKGKPLNKRKASIDYASDLVVRSLDLVNRLSKADTMLLFNRFVRDSFYPLNKRLFGQGSLMSDFYSNRIPMAHVAASNVVQRNNLVPLDENYVGSLGYTQEPGGKLRVFASPYLIWQSALEPLKRELKALLRMIPEDCTFDQVKGAEFAQECLKKGITVHSVDLSNASDSLPFSAQLEMLRDKSLNLPKELVDLFEQISKGSWKVPRDFRQFMPESITWSTGQPLGLGPSFGSFALWHNMLLSGICEAYRRYDYPYRILGDDVIIADDDVYRKYIQVMSEIGVTISFDKSHSSKEFAEFAGYAITKSMMVRPGKSRIADASNVISLALEYESSLEHEVTEEASKFIAKILSLPVSLGGKGMDLEDVTDIQLRLEQEQPEVNLSGELLERRLIKIYAQTGLFENVINDTGSDRITHKAMSPYLQDPRFLEYLKLIDFGKQEGYFTYKTNLGQKDLSKELSISWQLNLVAKMMDTLVATVEDTPTKLRICQFLRINPKQSVDKLRRSVAGKMTEYYASSACTEQTLPLVTWANKLQLQLSESEFFRPKRIKRLTSNTKVSRRNSHEDLNCKRHRVSRSASESS